MIHRRAFLAGSAAAVGQSVLGCRSEKAPDAKPVASAPAPVEPETPAAIDNMDEALERLSRYGHGGGNHAPMGAEALIAIGAGSIVMPWLEGYIAQENMVPRADGELISADKQPAALGIHGRIGDWKTTFRAAIEDRGWREVLSEWAPKLMPGLSAAATHGIIRTSHAVRSIERTETALRRHEVADGLAYWAAYYQPIHILKDNESWQPRLASEVIAGVAPAPKGRRNRRMMPSLDLRAEEPAFKRQVFAAGPKSGQAAAFLTDVTRTFAAIFAKYGAASPIALTHAVTGAASIRLLFPYLDDRQRDVAAFYGWQTAAGLWASFHQGPAPVASEAGDPGDRQRWDAILAGVRNSRADVHAIKLAEVCHRESKVAGDNRGYLAAARAVDFL